MNLYTNGLESAIKSAKTIVLFLTQRYTSREASGARWLMQILQVWQDQNNKIKQ